MRGTPAAIRGCTGLVCCNAGSKAIYLISVLLWAVIIFLPLVVVFAGTVFSQYKFEYSGTVFDSLIWSFVLAAAVGAAAVFLGYVPGRVLGTCRKGRDVLLLLLLTPLVLPRYLLYYAWTLLLSPTTQLGMYVAARVELARAVYGFASCSVLMLWYWPVASLLIAQGWRNIDRQIWDCAALDGGRFQVFARITLPLLARPILLAFGVCFVLSLSEFATFHLAGIPTVGTELAVLYEQTGSESSVAAAAAPVVLPAVLMAVVLGRSCRVWRSSFSSSGSVGFASQRWQWAVLFVLLGMSLVAPLAFLIGAVNDTGPFKDFLRLHSDELAWSFLISVVAAVIANLIAYAGLSLERTSGGSANPERRDIRGRRLGFFSLVITTTIFVAMFVPACLVAVSLLRMAAVLGLPSALRQGWYIVSAGQASRFAGVALILLVLGRHSHRRQLTEMASVNGASASATWWHVHLPHTLPLIVGSLLLITMLGITELSATMVLLPAGLPNFAQRLLNQMHYAREQQVIASCLVLAFVFLVLAVIVVLLLRTVRWSGRTTLLLFVVLATSVSGCDREADLKSPRYVLACFGRTGRGQTEFIYPRAIDIAGDGTLFVVDKTGRIQHVTARGKFLNVITMPLIEAGKPTGLSVGPDENLYVADTHYHRVVIFSPNGEFVAEFGRFGKEPGCFIYPTDIAFSNDGRIFVSEYGGNDRVSVFSKQREFLYCFGSNGSGPGQFARPSAVCVDAARKHLYVADACNHRIAVYELDGNLTGYIGSLGRADGQLRYPYDLALLSDRTLAVCEFGNNRLQLFSPEGRSLGVYGGPGREPGQLAYPWGVAVDAERTVFVVDAGNNRVQVWRL